MNCCNHTCEQGDTCPVRAARKVQTTSTPLITANSDGSSPHTHAQHRDQGMALPIVRIGLLLYAAFALWVYFFWH